MDWWDISTSSTKYCFLRCVCVAFRIETDFFFFPSESYLGDKSSCAENASAVNFTGGGSARSLNNACVGKVPFSTNRSIGRSHTPVTGYSGTLTVLKRNTSTYISNILLNVLYFFNMLIVRHRKINCNCFFIPKQPRSKGDVSSVAGPFVSPEWLQLGSTPSAHTPSPGA